MTALISKMQQLLEQPHLQLEGRIAFRRRWVRRHRPRKPPKPKTDWELDYDDEFNFAHKGIRWIDDPDWGLVKPKKPKAKKLSDFLNPKFIAETAEAMRQ